MQLDLLRPITPADFRAQLYIARGHMTVMIPVGQFHFAYLNELGAGGLGRVHRVRVTASNAFDKPVGSEWACKSLNDKWRMHPTAQARFDYMEIGRASCRERV